MNRVSVIQNFIIIACRNKIITPNNLVNRNINNKILSFMRYPLFGLLIILVSCGGMGKTGTK